MTSVSTPAPTATGPLPRPFLRPAPPGSPSQCPQRQDTAPEVLPVSRPPAENPPGAACFVCSLLRRPGYQTSPAGSAPRVRRSLSAACFPIPLQRAPFHRPRQCAPAPQVPLSIAAAIRSTCLPCGEQSLLPASPGHDVG